MHILLLFLISQSYLFGQTRVREKPYFPDILGYKTLICDFHSHTVFSDGNVWPSVRVEEAWREGLDAIAITDHIEYLPHKDDVRVDFNRSYEIAKPLGDAQNVIVIKGAEITRAMPPGHFNCIFLQDAEKLNVDDWRDAVKAAIDQGAFVFWNHPGWKGQQKDGVAKWYDEHSELLEKGWMHGIEVVNEREYYPQVHGWCLDKELTMLGNSDIHDPINLAYSLQQGDHRTLTLVFASDDTETSIKEALFAGRTAVYFGNTLIGKEKYLKSIFTNSVHIDPDVVTLKGQRNANLHITNKCKVDFQLKLSDESPKLSVPKDIVLFGGKTILFPVQAKSQDLTGTEEIALSYIVDNLKVEPEQGLPIRIKLKVTFTADN